MSVFLSNVGRRVTRTVSRTVRRHGGLPRSIARAKLDAMDLASKRAGGEGYVTIATRKDGRQIKARHVAATPDAPAHRIIKYPLPGGKTATFKIVPRPTLLAQGRQLLTGKTPFTTLSPRGHKIDAATYGRGPKSGVFRVRTHDRKAILNEDGSLKRWELEKREAPAEIANGQTNKVYAAMRGIRLKDRIASVKDRGGITAALRRRRTLRAAANSHESRTNRINRRSDANFNWAQVREQELDAIHEIKARDVERLYQHKGGQGMQRKLDKIDQKRELQGDRLANWVARDVQFRDHRLNLERVRNSRAWYNPVRGLQSLGYRVRYHAGFGSPGRPGLAQRGFSAYRGNLSRNPLTWVGIPRRGAENGPGMFSRGFSAYRENLSRSPRTWVGFRRLQEGEPGLFRSGWDATGGRVISSFSQWRANRAAASADAVAGQQGVFRRIADRWHDSRFNLMHHLRQRRARQEGLGDQFPASATRPTPATEPTAASTARAAGSVTPAPYRDLKALIERSRNALTAAGVSDEAVEKIIKSRASSQNGQPGVEVVRLLREHRETILSLDGLTDDLKATLERASSITTVA